MHTASRSGRRRILKPYILPLIYCLAGMLLAGAIFAGVNGFSTHTADSDTLSAIASAENAEWTGAFDAFDTIGYPNADIHGDILPRIQLHFYSAETLDQLLSQQYGAQYSLIDPEIYRYVTLTIEEIEAAAQQGTSIEPMIENLRVYMLMMQEGLAQRFDANGNILPASH